jgi:hypothetical protein
LPEYDFLMAGDGSRDGDDPETTEPVGADRSWVDDELLRTGVDLVGGDATGIGAIDGAGIFFIADGGARAICFGAAWAEYLSEDEPWLLALLVALSRRLSNFLRSGRRSAASSHLRALNEEPFRDQPLCWEALLEGPFRSATPLLDW